jgi:hypothetical protein
VSTTIEEAPTREEINLLWKRFEWLCGKVGEMAQRLADAEKRIAELESHDLPYVTERHPAWPFK